MKGETPVERKKYKFNIIDLFIILIIVCAIALLAYVFIFSNKTVEKYDFTTAGAIKLYAKIDSNMEYSYKGLSKDEIKALKEAGIYGGGQKSSGTEFGR